MTLEPVKKESNDNQTEKKGGRKPVSPIIALTIIVLTLTIGGYKIYGNSNSYLNCVGIWKNDRKVFYRQSVDDAKRYGNVACRERGQGSLINLKQFWLDPRYPESLDIANKHELKGQFPGFNISVYPEGKEYESPAFLKSTRIEYKELIPEVNNNSNQNQRKPFTIPNPFKNNNENNQQQTGNNNSNIVKVLDRVSCIHYSECPPKISEPIWQSCLDKGYTTSTPDKEVISARDLKELTVGKEGWPYNGYCIGSEYITK